MEGELCLLEVMRSVLLCMQEAVESVLCLREMSEVREETVALEELEELKVLGVLEVMRCVLFCMLEAVGVSSVCWR